MRPDIGPALAARLAHEARLDVGEPGVVRPAVGGHRDGMAASVVGAKDQDAARAASAGAHRAEADFDGAGVVPFHAPIKPRRERAGNLDSTECEPPVCENPALHEACNNRRARWALL